MHKDNRDYSLDIIRIIACMMVICIHTVVTEFYTPKVQSSTWGILNFYDTISRPGVPLFFMISGSLMLRNDRIEIKDLWKRKIFRIAAIFVIWIVFYYVIDTGLKYVLREPNNALKDIFTAENKYHLWYLRSLISLYALSPVFLVLVKKLDRSTVRYIFIVFIIFNSLRSTFLNIPKIPDWARWPFLLFNVEISENIVYFLLGYYLSNSQNELANRFSNRTLVIIYAIFLFLAAFFNHIFAIIINQPSTALYGNKSLPVFIESVCIFTLIRRKFISKNISKNKSNILKMVSRSTLFVYLIHPFFIDRMSKNFNYSILDFNVLISVPFTVFAIFIIGTFIGVLLERIPVINKIL